MVYALFKISHFAELKRWGKNQKGRLRLDERLAAYLLCDPLWQLICCTKWHLGTLGISTLPEIAVKTHFHTRNRTRTTQYFYLLMEDRFGCYWLLLPSLVSLLSEGTVQSKNTYFNFLEVAGEVLENQKWIYIRINNNYHQRSSPWVSFSWPNNLDLVLIILIGNYEAQDWLM